MRMVGERPEYCLGAAIDAAIRLDQLHGGFESAARHLGKARRHAGVLKREKIEAITDSLLPTANTPRAEMAVAVIDHQRLCGRRGDLDSGSHTGN